MTITPFVWRDEYGVNTETTNDQSSPDIAVLANGNYVITWEDRSQVGGDTSVSGIKAQMYSPFGERISSEFLVNTATNSVQRAPTITALSNGGFVIAYDSLAFPSAGRAQIFDADGNMVGSELTFNAGATFAPNIAPLDDGGFIVTWPERDSGSVSENDIRVRRYQADGTPTDASEIIVTTTPGTQFSPEVTSLAGGAFVVVWEDRNDTGTGRDIKAQVFDSSGDVDGPVFSVNSTTSGDQSSPAVTTLNNGTFVAVWDNLGIFGRIFNADGTPVANEFQIATGFVNAQVVALEDGGFAVTWRGGGTSTEIILQRFDESGIPIGTVVNVNTNTAGFQVSPNIAVTDDGRLIIAWRDDTEVSDDPDPTSIRSQILSLTNDNISGTPGDDTFAGDNAVNVYHGEGGDDTLSGFGGNDLIHGGDDDDTLDGGNGNDRIDGGDGNDWISGGFQSDILDGGDGIDTVDYTYSSADLTIDLVAGRAYGTASGPPGTEEISNFENVTTGVGDDIIVADGASNSLDGGADTDTVSYRSATSAVRANLAVSGGNTGDAAGDSYISIENLEGSDFDDALFGDAGTNLLSGLAGADALDGGAGNDTASYADSDAGVTVELGGAATGGHAEGDTLVRIENLIGSAFDDTLEGNGLANILSGGGNADTLKGGGGADILNGDDGDDTLEGGAGADALNGGSGTDTVSYNDSTGAVTVDLNANTASGGHAAGDTFSLIENVIGSRFGDSITGTMGNNELIGGAQSDTLIGLDGLDELVGGGGDDSFEGGTGADLLSGQGGRDGASYESSAAGVTISLVGNTASGGDAEGDTLVGIEDLVGSAFVDDLKGNAVANTLSGGDMNDALDGAGGADVINGGEGDDIITGGGGADTLNGDGGTDIVSYFASTALVQINLLADTATGGHANGDELNDIESVFGSRYNDILVGDDGANVLFGHTRDDRLEGGLGDDTLVGGTGSDTFVYTTTNWGQDTVNDFQNSRDKLDFTAVGLTFSDFTETASNGGTLLELTSDTAQSVFLTDIDPSTIDAGDFL